MKLAVLADIHGNKPALDAAIEDIRRERADRVIVAGDLVNRGPANRQVVETIADLGWEVLGGNHDDLVVVWARDQVPPEWHSDPWWTSLDWVAEQVADWIPFLERLPFHLRVEVGGAQPILIVHGSPRHKREGLRPRLSESEVRRILDGVPEPVVVGAHMHTPTERHVDGWHVVTVGAVGTPFNRDPRAQYALLALRDDGTWDVTFRTLDYDRDAAIKAFETSGYLQAGGLSAWLFRRELETARGYVFLFERWTNEQGLPLNWETWYKYVLRET